MTSEQLVSVAGVILSLALFYVPRLSTWYDARDAQIKAAVAGLLMIVVGAAAYGLSCTPDFAYFECTRAGGWQVVTLIVQALVANQATYLVARNFKAPPDAA